MGKNFVIRKEKMKHIIIKNAREHNLKSISLKIPRNKFIVITGLSGSGKSSLAFDTIYAEGQRRYVECLSSYARQFLEILKKPDVELIEGLSPAIAIEQKAGMYSPRSTVGTTTEIYDYLRLLFGTIGVPYCINCNIKIEPQSPQEIVKLVLKEYYGENIVILSPLVKGHKGEYHSLFEEVKKEGYMRIRIDGTIYRIYNIPELEKNKKHSIDLIIDRLTVTSETKGRLSESIETALEKGNGLVYVGILKGKEIIRENTYSSKFACKKCGYSLEELSPRIFSFNAPYGACTTCNGLGTIKQIDENIIIPDKNLSIAEGAIKPLRTTEKWNRNQIKLMSYYRNLLINVAYEYGIDIHKPWKELSEDEKNLILYGKGIKGKIPINRFNSNGEMQTFLFNFRGIITELLDRYKFTKSENLREKLNAYFSDKICPECNGARLKKEVLAVKFKGYNIYQLSCLPISELLSFFENIKLSSFEKQVAGRIIEEIKKRLKFIVDVGVGYISIDRELSTLSGGELQRIRLATQIGNQLVGVLYILDEPSIGLHPRDTYKLINTLKNLRDLGNTIIVVEHDEEIILNSDFIIDMGPFAGEKGGEVVFSVKKEKIFNCKNSLTAKYLKKELSIPIPSKRRTKNKGYIEIIGASEHNLKNINVKIPLEKFVCITGVSGSGKSTLINDILYNYLHNLFYKSQKNVGKVDRVNIKGKVSSVILVDQSPIGRTPRSNPATYIQVFQYIRKIFASLPAAKLRGYDAGRFSFNMPHGRCMKCKGEGYIKYEMQFLADVYVECDECKGKRYNEDTLQVKYKGYSIADVLDMTVEQALEFFKNYSPIKRKLELLKKVGLDYIKLGQPAPTLSGGEAQRIKLARELSKVKKGSTVYILDEPTTGLHFHDVHKLIEVLHLLVDNGNTVIVIEHNLDVIKNADYIIDLGPEGGKEGGYVVAYGTPEEIINSDKSYTAKYLREKLL